MPHGSTLALAAALLAYGNFSAWLATRGGREMQPGLNRGHVAMLAAVLAWARLEGVGPEDLGLGRRGLGSSLLCGALAGAVCWTPVRCLAARLAARYGVIAGAIEGMTRKRQLELMAGQLLIGSALFEEVAFRGLLMAKIARLIRRREASLIHSGVFVGWHLVIAWHNVRKSGLPFRLVPLAYLGVLAALMASGLLLGGLRQATGHLAGGTVAHWLVLAAALVGVSEARRRDSRGCCGPAPGNRDWH